MEKLKIMNFNGVFSIRGIGSKIRPPVFFEYDFSPCRVFSDNQDVPCLSTTCQVCLPLPDSMPGN